MDIRGTSEFPKIYYIGSSNIEDILSSAVEITEKLDGSQIGFGCIEDQLIIRSKSSELDIHKQNEQELFASAIESILKVKDRLVQGWFYYGEAFQSKRPNKLIYDEIPKGHIALFAIKKEDQSFVSDYKEISKIAEKLDIDVVPLVYSGVIDAEKLEEMLSKTKSKFGAPYVEGLIVKNYAIPGEDASIMVGKLVVDEFKEVRKDKKPKGVGKDIESRVRSLFKCYATQARWDKAIQHLRERNELKGNSSDIGPLIKEIQQDVFEEEGESLKEELWNALKKDFYRELVRGFAEYYLSIKK